MLDTVRNRLLNFILEIEEVEPNAGEVPSINRIDTTVTRQIFNRCIMNNYEGPVHNIQDNKGSNIATDRARRFPPPLLHIKAARASDRC